MLSLIQYSVQRATIAVQEVFWSINELGKDEELKIYKSKHKEIIAEAEAMVCLQTEHTRQFLKVYQIILLIPVISW